MLLEHGGRTEVSELLDRYDVKPDIRFTTWDDYAILSMIEQGLGIGILHRLILQRISYDLAISRCYHSFFVCINDNVIFLYELLLLSFG